MLLGIAAWPAVTGKQEWNSTPWSCLGVPASLWSWLLHSRTQIMVQNTSHLLNVLFKNGIGGKLCRNNCREQSRAGVTV